MSILCLSGLPGSGKTTYALEWLAEAPDYRLRVNYDDLRVELYGCKGTTYFQHKDVRGREKAIKFEALRLATEAANEGMDVVIDNTNLTTSARAPWEALAKSLDTPYIQHDIDTPVHECVRRDKERAGDARVGRAVIERMALTTGWIDWRDEEIYPRQRFVIVDIDGTLSDPSHRLHHITNPNECDCGASTKEQCVKDGCGAQGFKPRWDKFHAEVDKDPPKPQIVELVNHLSYYYDIIIVSGRSPEHGCGIKTEDWLDAHMIPYSHLFMRAAGDYKPDYEHKQEILDLLPKDRIAFVLDDRDQVVQMWRRNGLTCLQVAKGDF